MTDYYNPSMMGFVHMEDFSGWMRRSGNETIFLLDRPRPLLLSDLVIATRHLDGEEKAYTILANPLEARDMFCWNITTRISGPPLEDCYRFGKHRIFRTLTLPEGRTMIIGDHRVGIIQKPYANWQLNQVEGWIGDVGDPTVLLSEPDPTGLSDVQGLVP